MAKIGFIGLGHMGLPMAINLVKAGHEVTGLDLQVDAIKTLVKAGGLAAEHLENTAKDKDFFITMLQTGHQVKQICMGEGGLYYLETKAMHIDCSTIDVDSSRELHEEADKKQILSLDAPVSGGVAGAKAASLTFMAGGREYCLEKALPILEVMGKKIIYTGLPGSGQAAKICNNMILGISMIAISEAFVLAEQLNLSHEKLFEVINNASGQCWASSNYVPVPDLLPNVPANKDYKPGFSVAMMLKDLLLSQEAANSVGVQTILGDAATALYQEFNNTGFHDLDFSGIIKMVRDQSTLRGNHNR
jgi:3-hydroxyisobutyrate dehydrogenase